MHFETGSKLIYLNYLNVFQLRHPSGRRRHHERSLAFRSLFDHCVAEYIPLQRRRVPQIHRKYDFLYFCYFPVLFMPEKVAIWTRCIRLLLTRRGRKWRRWPGTDSPIACSCRPSPRFSSSLPTCKSFTNISPMSSASMNTQATAFI